MLQFPDDFFWGAATSAYQIEGSHNADGKGPSVWDTFCQRPGVIVAGHTGNVAADHVRRFREDVALMRELGLQAYRFSLSWSRILPNGVGAVNESGLRFYEELLDALLEAGIRPLVTLFHWDYPQALADQGGWLHPDSPLWFEEYARVVATRLGSRVQDWITLNEPGIYLNLGSFEGTHAPGLKLTKAEMLTCYKHTFLSHGRAVAVLRELSPGSRVSIAPHCVCGEPIDESEPHVAAAREYTFGESAPERAFWQQRLYVDPVIQGEWPEKMSQDLAPDWELPSSSEMALMSPPLDYFCINFYSSPLIQAGKEGVEVVPDPPGMARTLFDWPMRERGLYYATKFHHERTNLPIVISENGLSCMDWVALDGCVHDPQRIDFLRRYLGQLHRATQDGIPVLGYCHWSLLDNFEWADGYRQRFGLIHVDFQTQKRTIKDSGYAYARWIQQNGID